MNLFDKKLKEKFMLFDNIDNEININNHQKQTNKSKNNKNHYNDIYCNFILSQYNFCQSSPCSILFKNADFETVFNIFLLQC